MKATILESIPEDKETILAWNNLVFQMELPEVFYTQQWAWAASRAFSDRFSPLTLLFHEAGQLCGVAAMARDRGRPDQAFFLGASTADYCDIVSAPEKRQAVVAALFSEMKRRNIRNLVLANVPSDSRTVQALRGVARSRHFYIHERPAYECAIISLRDEEERQAVIKSVLRKEQEKRGLKKLRQLGPIRIAHLTRDQLETGLVAIFTAHISRFLATNRRSPFINRQRRIFLTELGQSLSAAGWLKFSQLEAGEQAIAWNYGFLFLDTWFWYLPTFDVHFQDCSPGSCLLRLLIEEACANSSVKRLDLGLGDESYKSRFANDIRPTRYVQLSQSLPRHLANVGRHRLRKFARKSPGIEKPIRSARSIFYRLRERVRNTGIVSTTRHLLKNAIRHFVSEDEVVFFEAPPLKTQPEQGLALIPLTLEKIALAAMESADDEATLDYLARSAERLGAGRANGYILGREGTAAAHFLWVDRYDGFYVEEINERLESDDSSAAMIFDCWTPASQRGQGNYQTAIRLAAALLQQENRKAWIFAEAENKLSVQGIVKAGFAYRFSLVRRRRLGRATLSRRDGGLTANIKSEA